MSNAPAQPLRVPVPTVIWIFFHVGLTAFGGGTTAWVHRELVERRKYMTDEEFLAGLTIAQVLPGANPVNLALYMGRKLRGGIGAIIAVLGMVTPAFCVIIAIATLYGIYGELPVTHVILGALACVGIGATLSMATKVVVRGIGLNFVPAAIAIAVYVAVAILQWPTVPVVAVAVPASLLFSYWRERRLGGG
jgi:chromate transporter